MGNISSMSVDTADQLSRRERDMDVTNWWFKRINHALIVVGLSVSFWATRRARAKQQSVPVESVNEKMTPLL